MVHETDGFKCPQKHSTNSNLQVAGNFSFEITTINVGEYDWKIDMKNFSPPEESNSWTHPRIAYHANQWATDELVQTQSIAIECPTSFDHDEISICDDKITFTQDLKVVSKIVINQNKSVLFIIQKKKKKTHSNYLKERTREKRAV